MYDRKMKANNGEKLTQAQIDEVAAQYKKITEANEKYKAKIAQLEEKLKDKHAQHSLDLIAREQRKQFVDISAGAGYALRMAKAYWNSFRTIIADSAFSSVKTALALRARGLYFIGNVKTAHREFPKKFFHAWAEDRTHRPRKGEFKVLTTTEPAGQSVPQACTVGAVAWMDVTVHTLVFTAGHTGEGADSIRYRPRPIIDADSGQIAHEMVELRVSRPKVVEQFFEGFNAIDVHDHYRQGSLQMEKHFHTYRWWFRMFTTVLGIVVTNAYLHYKYENDSDGVLALARGTMSIMEFVGRSAKELTNLMTSTSSSRAKRTHENAFFDEVNSFLM